MPTKRKAPPSPTGGPSAASQSKAAKAKQAPLDFGRRSEEGAATAVGSGKAKRSAKRPMKGLSGFVSAFQSQLSTSSAVPQSQPFPDVIEYHDLKGKGKAKADVIEIQDTSSEDDVDMNDEVHDYEERQMQMWTELYAPTSSVELAPTKQRITAVRQWLEEAMTGIPAGVDKGTSFSDIAKERIRKYRRILVLTGPAGVGKTTTIRVLAKELDIELLEWSEGVEEWGMSGLDAREGLTSKMLSFLSRNRYSSLPLNVVDSRSAAHSQHGRTTQHDSGHPPAAPRRLMLLSSLPNLSSPTTRQVFQTALLEYAQSYTSGSCPLVIIVSDTGSAGRAETSWMDRGGDGEWDVRSVVGKDLMAHPAVSVVDFLSMAPTFMIKALKRIIPFAFPDTKTRPSADTLQLIASTSNGDLRSAINSLQFLSRGPGKELSKLNARAKKTGKGSRGGQGAKTAGSRSLRALLDAVSRREQSLGLFHALGKVLYNKRIGDDAVDDASEVGDDVMTIDHEPLPPHLAQFERRRYENDFEALLASVPVDTSTFALWIQQNVAQYCTEIEQMDAILDDLCRADNMRSDDDLWQRSQHAIQYAFHVIIRGTAMGLPSPVPRMGQKTYKPEFFGWLKTTKDQEAGLRDASDWYERSLIGTPAHEESSSGPMSDKRSNWSGQVSREAFVLDILPYLRQSQEATAQADLMDSLRLPNFSHPSLLPAANGLEILTEKDDRLAPEDEDIPEDPELATKKRILASTQEGDEDPAAVTWLEEDDIDEF